MMNNEEEMGEKEGPLYENGTRRKRKKEMKMVRK
jgi:hypothetical protein